MTWNWADILVLVLCAAQVFLLVALVVVVLRIKNGPVARVTERASALAEKASALAETGQQAVARNQGHVLGIASAVRDLSQAVRPAAEPAGLLFGYGDLRRWYANALLARGAVTEVRRRLKPEVQSVAPPGPAAGPAGRRRLPGLPRAGGGGASWAERLGLIPPIVIKAAPLVRAARVGWQAYQTVQQQGKGRKSEEG